MNTIKETNLSDFSIKLLENLNQLDGLEYKGNSEDFSKEAENLKQEEINLIQKKVFDIFNSTLHNYANNQEDYIKKEQLILGKNLSIFLKNIAQYNNLVDESIYNKIDNKISKIEKTLNEYNEKSREDLLIDDLLNGRMPNKLSHYEFVKMEDTFSYDKESLKKSLLKLEDKDYKKIISTLDKAYQKITQDIADKLASGEINEFKNFNTHTVFKTLTKPDH